MVQNTWCKLCNEAEESTLHLFGSCRVTEQIWDLVSHWCRLKSIYILELKDLAIIQNQNRGSVKWRKVISLVIQTVVWVIWRTRNEATFNGKQANLTRMKEEIKMLGYMWLKSRANALSLTWENWCHFDLISVRL
ncbi:hypothetical protein HanRHA438_Chr04g0185621 [Helianthus annuus]|nr:hypothetical protein HanHA89_Chr04g0157331 [Helianthus annuus]KAJ0927681.1 hypothetical protein HanRHA438_Chr04g0185621 [Helianthus annuus]